MSNKTAVELIREAKNTSLLDSGAWEFALTKARELDESRAYADRLVEHFANGSLPKDVELLREANAEMAQELHELKTKPFAGMHEGCVAFLKLPVKLKSLDALNTFIKLAYGKECFVKEETGWLQVAKQGEA